MKKMRKLIPAFAMLMVAAIMMTTASFAWFTMNEQVTASGIQIQAQGDASMLISDAPINNVNTGSGDFTSTTGINKMKPMAHKGATNSSTLGVAATGETAGWYYPTDNEVSNVATGANSGGYTAVTAAGEGVYYYAEEYYIATAGTTFTTDLKITLTAPTHPATGETHLAFSAAIYMIGTKNTGNGTAWNNNVMPTFFGADAVAPTAIVHVDSTPVNGQARNEVTIEDVEIPSIAGATQEASVGMKFVVVYYIDGALQSTGNKTVTVVYGQKHNLAKDEEFSEDEIYYTFNQVAVNENASVDGYYVEGTTAGEMVPAKGKAVAGTTYYTRAAAPVNGINPGDKITGDWYVAGATDSAAVNYCYVRSAEVQGTGSTLQLTFARP